MNYAVVYWIDENKYSVVSLKKDQLEDDFGDPNTLVVQVYPVKWRKGQCYNGEIKAIGTKVEMLEQKRFWENAATDVSFTEAEVNSVAGHVLNLESPPSPRATNKKTPRPSIHDLAANGADREFEVVPILPNNDWERTRIRELENDLMQKDKECAKEKLKNKSLSRLIKKSCAAVSTGETVKIGEGVEISKKLEIAASSVTGKRTVQSPLNQTRTAVDPTEFKVLKDYTIACCALSPNTVDMFKFEARI